jgi:D-xylose transport system permease protein
VKIQKKTAYVGTFLRKNVILVALIVFMALFQIITNGLFLGPRNLSNLLRQTSIIGVVTMSMLMLIISGNIDLACGMSVAAGGGIAAIAMVKWGFSMPVAIVLAMILGVLIGLWQGLWIAKGGLVPFICTLGNQLLFKGLYLTIIQGKTIGPVSSKFKFISQGYIPVSTSLIICAIIVIVILYLEVGKRKKAIQYGLDGGSMVWMFGRMVVYIGGLVAVFWRLCQHQGLPVPVLIMFSIVALTSVILTKTRFGRRVYAIGGNNEAAKLSGINVNRHIVTLYVIAGLFAAIAGCMLVARLDGAVNTAGNAYETDSISACVIGGASMNGGIGTVFGAILGALLIAVLENGMGLMNISTYVQFMVKGLVLLVAVWFDISSQKAGKK